MKVLKQLFEERRKNAEPRENKDFLDLVIEELKKEKPLLNQKTAFNLLYALLFASFETTSSGITIALKFLAENPKALRELTVRKWILSQNLDIIYYMSKVRTDGNELLLEPLR